MRRKFSVVFLLAPALASAEVIDKEFFLPTVACVTLFNSAAAF